MEPPKRKITAKVSTNNIHSVTRSDNGTLDPSASHSQSTSISGSLPQVARAKVSSAARIKADARTLSSAQSKSAGSTTNNNGVLPSQVREAARRSPSPVKMMARAKSPTKVSTQASRPSSPSKTPISRPTSPFKLQYLAKQSTLRNTVSPTMLKPNGSHHSRRASLTAIFSSQPSSTPNTPIPVTGPGKWETDAASHKPSSLRVKAKVTSIAKPSAPSMSTIISPPSPSSPSSALSSPVASRPPPRVRTMTTTRRPSATFSVSDYRPASPEARLVPLPTSPPASTLSFSSHSSTSASTGYTTSATPPIPHTNIQGPSTPTSGFSHSLQMQLSALEEQKVSSPEDHDPESKPLSIRTLTARVRPGTRISGGRTSAGSSAAGEANTSDHPSKFNGYTMEDTASHSNEEDENSPRSPRRSQSLSDDPELEVRAEAKSIRKIADLEITTASLLTINSNLEATKVRQAREIRELRRKLREVRLSLPPKRFRVLSEDEDGDGEGEDDEEDDEQGDAEEAGEDETFCRIKSLVENLLAAGRSALAVPAPSFGVGIEDMAPSSSRELREVAGAKHGVAIGSRVLSAEEAKPWLGDDHQAQDVQQEREVNEDATDELDTHDDTGDEEEVEQVVGGALTLNIDQRQQEESSRQIPPDGSGTDAP